MACFCLLRYPQRNRGVSSLLTEQPGLVPVLVRSDGQCPGCYFNFRRAKLQISCTFGSTDGCRDAQLKKGLCSTSLTDRRRLSQHRPASKPASCKPEPKHSEMHGCFALKQSIHPHPNPAPSNSPNLGGTVGNCARTPSAPEGQLTSFGFDTGLSPSPFAL